MRVYTKATPKLVELWKNYKGKKSGYIRDVEAFDNCDNEGNTGDFYACHTLSCAEYKTHGYTEVSEQEFINTINNEIPKEGNSQEGEDSEVFNPQPHYDNSKGSLYKIATERGWSPYTFDVVKRLDRGGKKDPLKQEIQKSIDVLTLWLKELD